MILDVEKTINLNNKILEWVKHLSSIFPQNLYYLGEIKALIDLINSHQRLAWWHYTEPYEVLRNIKIGFKLNDKMICLGEISMFKINPLQKAINFCDVWENYKFSYFPYTYNPIWYQVYQQDICYEYVFNCVPDIEKFNNMLNLQIKYLENKNEE